MRLIDADQIVNYEITGNFSCGELKCTDKFVLLPVHHLYEIPSVKDYFSYEEFKMLSELLKSEREQYEKIGGHLSIRLLDEIEKKIHDIQYGSR